MLLLNPRSYCSLWILSLALMLGGCSKPAPVPEKTQKQPLEAVPTPFEHVPVERTATVAPVDKYGFYDVKVKAEVVPPAPLFVAPVVVLPQVAWNLICDSEVGTTSESYYMSHKIRFPEWSGGYSGITWGIGYDGSTETRSAIIRDWKALNGVERLADTCKYKGQAAREQLTTVNDIVVPWHIAVDVFNNSTIPVFYQSTKRAFPGLEWLANDAQGALVSLVYNRGSSLVGASRVDMRDIAAAVPKKDYKAIAAALRHMNVTMCNTWSRQGVYTGLSKRRELEAELVESCLNK